MACNGVAVFFGPSLTTWILPIRENHVTAWYSVKKSAIMLNPIVAGFRTKRS